VLNFKNSQTAGESCEALTVPAELIPVSEPSFLLPGESLPDFEAIRQMLVDDIQPETNIEWLWTLDLVELSWEILRYRRLKKKDSGRPSRSRNRSHLAATGWRRNACRGHANGPDTSKAQPLRRDTSVHLFARCIVALAGPEQLFDSSGQTDRQIAAYFAGIVSSKPAAFLNYARIDAERILSVNKPQIEAIAAALLECKTLDGAEIDEILSGMSLAQMAERARRKQWNDVAAGAALFTAAHGGLKMLQL
jgi:hypothetical protein